MNLPIEMIEAAARADHEYDRAFGEPTWELLPDEDRDYCRKAMTTVLVAALSVCKTHTEWGSEHVGDRIEQSRGERVFIQSAGTDEEFARSRVDWWRADGPDVESRLLRRQVTTVYGEWESGESS